MQRETTQKSDTAPTLIVPDLDEVRPRRPIPQSEITRVINLHIEMLDLRRMALNRAMNIGFKLRCWHDLIPHGKWAKWCQANIPEIPERTIQRYIQLWDNQELIRSHFKSDTVSDLNQVIGVREALEFLQDRRAAEAKPNSAKRLLSGTKPIQKAPSAKKELNKAEAVVEAGLPEVNKVLDAIDQFAGHSNRQPITVQAEMLDKLCPVCRVLVENAPESESIS